MTNLINFKNITINRDDRTIMDSFTLQVKANENIAVLGPNGSGKSTFIKLITRENYPSYTGDDSVCEMFDKQNWSLDEVRKNLGIITNDLQEHFKNITGLNVILTGFFGSYRLYNEFKITKKMLTKAKEMAEFLGITTLNNRLVDTMSSGEQRRFLIARALVNEPKALILDEPTNSLDVKAIKNLKNTMSNITKQGKNLILVTHTTSDIIPEINRVIMIKNGKIFADGNKKDILIKDLLKELFEMELELIKSENDSYSVVF